MAKVDLNCDLGESFGRYTLGLDEEVIPLITSANVACGMHAGDPVVMRKTVARAAKAGVSVGAHPGYPDLQGFGRRDMAMSPEEVYAYTVYQVGALKAFCEAEGVRLGHVKPHGQLYNTAAKNKALADAIATAVYDVDPSLVLVGLSGGLLIEAAKEKGLKAGNEFFADRAYTPEGALVPRSVEGSTISDDELAVARTVRAVKEGVVEAIDGSMVSVAVDTICIHGDGPKALLFANKIRQALLDAGVELAHL